MSSEEEAEEEKDNKEGRKEGGLREEPRDYLLPRRSFQTQGAFFKACHPFFPSICETAQLLSVSLSADFDIIGNKENWLKTA